MTVAYIYSSKFFDLNLNRKPRPDAFLSQQTRHLDDPVKGGRKTSSMFFTSGGKLQ